MVYVNDITIVGPGLIDPVHTRTILLGQNNWIHDDMPVLKPEMLPANERRRTTPVIKLALECIQGLLKDHDDLQSMATVFASSDGDFKITDEICTSLAETEKIISPTLFHNSVYNAPAGYWSIASSMSGPSTSLSAGNSTFMCGLQEAVSQVEIDGSTVLFVAYDYPAPPQLDKHRHFDYPLAIAMRLGKVAEHKGLGTLSLDGLEKNKKNSRCRNISLELLRKSSPIGYALPLVEALTRKARMEVIMPYLRNSNFRILVSH